MVAINRSDRLPSHIGLPNRLRHLVSESRTEAILFTTDLSETSRDGLKLATAIAKSREATLILLHVVDLPTSGEDLLFDELRPHRLNAKVRLRTFVPTELAVPFTHTVVYGDPVTEIVSIAKHEKVSLIVVGTHQRRGLHRLLVGSTAEGVIRSAPCPVLAFPQESASTWTVMD